MGEFSPLASLVANDEGRQLPGASASRLVPVIGGGEYHIKLARMGSDEVRRGPANELLGNRLLESLGLARSGLAIVRIPDTIRARSAEMANVICEEAFGARALDPQPADLPKATIQVLGPATSADVLLAQDIVLRWLGNNDHEEHNFIEVAGMAIVMDFAATPLEAVWTSGADIGQPLGTNYGGLEGLIKAIQPSLKEPVLSCLEAVSADDLGRILAEVPECWASAAEKRNVVAALMRRKGDLSACY